MNTHYYADMFCKCKEKKLSKQEAIACKINLLKDFFIVTSANECSVRKFLSQFDNEYQMTAVLHDVLAGRKNITEVIQ